MSAVLRIGFVIAFGCAAQACCEAQRWLGGTGAGLCAAAPEPEDAGVAAPPPVVMMLIDTSGSMSMLPGCSCGSVVDCSNCDPNCALGQQNRWYTVLAALNGSYENFSCQPRPRTAANGATYDDGYGIPLYALGAETTQLADGLIEAWSDRIRFGLATFDGEYTYRGGSDLIPPSSFDFAASEGMPGLFSYGGASPEVPRFRLDGSEIGRVFFPGCVEPYYVDSGIRSAGASDGALSLPQSGAAAVLRAQLSAARPYGGTPIASALDDLYAFFSSDPQAQAIAGASKRYVVLVTDGTSDRDFRDLGCDCAAWGICDPWVDPAQVSCPYPTAADAARHLACGFDASRCDGVIDGVYVVGLSVDDPSTQAELDQLAAAGGTTSARSASDLSTLREALGEVFEDVSAQ